MRRPERGEIWRVRLADVSTGREAYGTEIANKRDPKEETRPCVIVSANVFNRNRKRLTVAPLNNYSEAKEDSTGRWAIVLRKGLEFTEEPSARDYLEAKSIVDCGQLWTVFCVDRRTPGAGQDINDVFAGQPLGKLTSFADVNAALQLHVGGGVRLLDEGVIVPRKALPRQEGDVFDVVLPGSGTQTALVVSSTAIDYLRRYKLRQVTVVPLIYEESHGGEEESTVRVEVSGRPARAQCQEIYTIDWNARGAAEPQGRVTPARMAAVRRALRHYLSLPRCAC